MSSISWIMRLTILPTTRTKTFKLLEAAMAAERSEPVSSRPSLLSLLKYLDPALIDKLKELGAKVEEIYVYESSLPVDAELKGRFFQDLTSGKIDAIVFGSGLSAKNIFKMLSEKAPMETLRDTVNCNVTTVAIGPTTAEALMEMGVKVDVTPEDYLFEKALTALAAHWVCH